MSRASLPTTLICSLERLLVLVAVRAALCGQPGAASRHGWRKVRGRGRRRRRRGARRRRRCAWIWIRRRRCATRWCRADAEKHNLSELARSQEDLEALRREHHKQGLQNQELRHNIEQSLHARAVSSEGSAVRQRAGVKFKSLDATHQQKATRTPQLDAQIKLKNQAMAAKLRESGFATEALRRRQLIAE